MSYWIEITRSGRKSQRHELGSAQVTIGSAATSTIRLVGESALLPQHILLAPSEAQCWVSTASGAPVRTDAGMSLEGAYVDWGTTLSLGSLSMQLRSDDIDSSRQLVGNPRPAAADKESKSSKQIHPGIVMILISTLLFGAYEMLSTDSAAQAALPKSPPGLFAAPKKCASRNPLHRAVQAEQAGLAKRERYVFDPQDGITAVELFAESEACYRAASMSTQADASSELANDMRRALEEDFKLLQLRLSRALDAGDTTRALTPLHTLTALLRHQPESDYALALRRLALRLSKEN